MICVKCHREIPQNSKYCSYCGSNQSFNKYIHANEGASTLSRFIFLITKAFATLAFCFLAAIITLFVVKAENKELGDIILQVPLGIWLYILIPFGFIYIYRFVKWLYDNSGCE